jgi:hypothetical protein
MPGRDQGTPIAALPMSKPTSLRRIRPIAAVSGLLSLTMFAPAMPAQNGNLFAGSALGNVYPAGDVDDDGRGDYFLRTAQGWEVRSGPTGLPFPYLTRSATNCLTCLYTGLHGDLDVDGHDDLLFADGNGLIQFLSGASGAPLLQYTMLGAFAVARAVDHDGDGHDDVMVVQDVPASGGSGVVNHYVFSGRNGTTIASYAMPYTAFNYGRVQWCGDVDGDGYVDLLRTTVSLGNPNSVVLLGPTHTVAVASYSGTPVAPAGDTNADGRDELIVGADLVDVTTGAVVWAMLPLFPSSNWFTADVDGDGAIDALTETQAQVYQAYSGRTQTAWPAVLPATITNLGDLDADGRDELVVSGTLYELLGAPQASLVRDRGAPGTTSVSSRPRIHHRLRPRFGSTMLVDLNGAGGVRLAFLAIGGAIDIDLAPFGAPGNRAYVHPLDAPTKFTDAGGHASYALAVPNAPVLLGQPLSLQWAVVDPAANALGIVASDVLDCFLGY